MDVATQVQVLDELIAFHIQLITLGKSMDSTILLPAMGKIVGETRLFNLGMAINLNSNLLNSKKLTLCHILLM